MLATVAPFTSEHAALLARFLSSPQRTKDTLTDPQLVGFLFCLANGREMIPPSEWIPLVFNGQEAQHEILEEAELVPQAMMALYNDCIRERTVGGVSLRPGCEMKSGEINCARTLLLKSTRKLPVPHRVQSSTPTPITMSTA